jgi:glycerophosphoryl diester phosphodiesterase
MVIKTSTPVIFAHRGASAHAPENTISAFRLAINQGVSAIELDVQLTADHEVIVFHDSILDRITNSKGKIKDYQLAELKQIDAGYAYGEAFRNEGIPTLSEVFSEISNASLFNIELKNLSSPLDNLPEKVLEIIRDHKCEDNVLISSFNPIALRRFYRLNQDILLGRLIHTPLIFNLQKHRSIKDDKFYSVHIAYSLLTEKRLAYIKSHGKKVYTYTLNHPDDILRALDLGVDGFFTDDPGLALRTINKSSH